MDVSSSAPSARTPTSRPPRARMPFRTPAGSSGRIRDPGGQGPDRTAAALPGSQGDGRKAGAPGYPGPHDGVGGRNHSQRQHVSVFFRHQTGLYEKSGQMHPTRRHNLAVIVPKTAVYYPPGVHPELGHIPIYPIFFNQGVRERKKTDRWGPGCCPRCIRPGAPGSPPRNWTLLTAAQGRRCPCPQAPGGGQIAPIRGPGLVGRLRAAGEGAALLNGLRYSITRAP